MPKHVVIAGGGLAGLTCAKYLADAGYQVSLYEGLPYLGGRASTYRDRDGDWVEQGLHLFLGVYSEFKQLLRDIGQEPDQILCWMDQVRLQAPEGAEAVYGVNPLRSPIKTALSVLTQNGFLNALDKASLAPLVAPSLLDMAYLAREHDRHTVADWWAAASGSDHVKERFLRPFCRAIQFTDLEQYSAYNFLGLVHHVAYGLPENLLGGYRGAREETIFQPLANHLKARGVGIRTGIKLNEVQHSGEGTGNIGGFVLENGEAVTGDVYVIAVPAWAFVQVMPVSLRTMPFFSSIAALPIAPAISVQLWFHGQAVRHTDYALVGRSFTPVYQDQATSAYPFDRGSRLSVIVSPADEWLEVPEPALLKMVLDSLAKVEPAIRQAGVIKSVVLRHRDHLVRPLPGAMTARPTQVTPVQNLFLAGDWTAQDFFGSQEGAVRSGKACARAVAEYLSPGSPSR